MRGCARQAAARCSRSAARRAAHASPSDARRSSAQPITARRQGRFGHVLGRGRRLTGRLLQIIVDPAGEPAVVVVVAKKLLPAAVRRNRARRVIRELFRREGASLSRATVVFRIRQVPRDPCMRDLVDEARALVHRAAEDPTLTGGHR